PGGRQRRPLPQLPELAHLAGGADHHPPEDARGVAPHAHGVRREVPELLLHRGHADAGPRGRPLGVAGAQVQVAMSQKTRMLVSLVVTLVLAGALGAYAYFGVFQKEQEELAAKETEEKLFRLDPEAISALT